MPAGRERTGNVAAECVWRGLGIPTGPLLVSRAVNTCHFPKRERSGAPSIRSMALQNADMLRMILSCCTLRTMAHATAVSKLWQNTADQRLWAHFCDLHWPGVRSAAGLSDIRLLVKRLLEGSRVENPTRSDDVVLIVECSGWLDTPVVVDFHRLPTHVDQRYVGDPVIRYQIHMRGVGSRASITRFLENCSNLSIRLLRRCDGKMAILKRRTDEWNVTRPFFDKSTGPKDTAELQAEHAMHPSKRVVSLSRAIPDSNEFIAYTVHLNLFPDLQCTNGDFHGFTPDHLYLKLDKWRCTRTADPDDVILFEDMTHLGDVKLGDDLVQILPWE